VLLHYHAKHKTFFAAELTTTYRDPLEQFDVLSLSLPLVGAGFTNLALLLMFNLFAMAA